MKNLFFILLFLAAVITETKFLTLPLLLILLLIFYIFNKSLSLFIHAFIFGILLDIFLVRPLGQTSLFFVVFFFVVLLYENKFEIKTAFFVILFSFFGSLLFLFLSSYHYIFWQAIVSSLISVLAFFLISHWQPKILNKTL